MPTSLTVRDLADRLGATVVGDAGRVISGVGSLIEAGPDDVTFLANPRYAGHVARTKAGAVILGAGFSGRPGEGQAFLVCQDPNLAFAAAAALFAPPPVRFAPGVHPTAVVADSACLGPGVHVGPHAVIEPGARVGEGSVVAAGSYVGHEAGIGRDCLIYPLVMIRDRCLLGDRVIVHSCAVIGADGFGYGAGPHGLVKIPQFGIAQLDDDVEIGACSTVDRGRFGRTWIKAGVKIDNAVQIGHNAVIGEHTMLIAQSGVAGSAEVGRWVVAGARAGINGHITIGDGTMIAGTSGVQKSLPPGSRAAGTPAETVREWTARHKLPGKVENLERRLREVEAELQALKAQLAAR